MPGKGTGPGPVARRILELAGIKGINQAELSRRSGISQQAMQKWFKGLTRPTLDNRRVLAKVLDVPVSELLLDEDEEQAKVESDKAIEQYIASPQGADLTEAQRDQLRLSIAWIEPGRAMTPLEVADAANFIRRRVQGDLKPINPSGSGRGKPKR